MMSDDERSLLEAIRRSVGSYQLEHHISDRIYPYTSYILKNVTALRLDGWKMALPSISDEGVSESTVAELDFTSRDFKDIGIILKEIGHASSTEMDEHKFALSLPGILRGKNYTMNFILVGTLAAFALTHGVWLLVLKFVCANYSNEQEIMMVLKRVEGLFITLRRNQGKGGTDYHLDFYIYISLLSSLITRMPRDNWESMGSLYSLIQAMFDVVSVAHIFLRDVFNFIPKILKDEFDNLVLLSIYWVTRGVFACSSQCNELPIYRYIFTLLLSSIVCCLDLYILECIELFFGRMFRQCCTSFACFISLIEMIIQYLLWYGSSIRFVVQDSQKLTDICDKLVSIHIRLQKLDNNGKQYMDDEKITNAYQIPDKEGQDNYFALMGLFGLQPDRSGDVKLSHCSRKADMDLSMVTLRRKTLLLLISGLEISSNVISFLKDIYVEYATSLIQEANCEFIWLPIHSGPWITSLEEKYTKLLQMMPWYTVLPHPNFITEKTKKFVRDIWMFHRKPIAVVLNEDGNVVCPNAMHMMYIWGTKAFPFTRMRERSLWTVDTRLSSLVLGFDSHISSMFEASKWIILYGGININWIQKFITCVRERSVGLGTQIEMIYVEKNAELENIGKVFPSMFVDDMVVSYPVDSSKIWYFWMRLESFLISRYQAINATHYTMDPIIREIKKLLSYASAESWACLITPSSDLIIHGLGDTMLQGFMEFDSWKQHLHSKDFSKILLDHIEQIRQNQVSDQPCSRIFLNIDNKDVVRSLECPHCNHSMEKKVQYRCCHTHDEL